VEAQLTREAVQLREGGAADPYGLRVAEAKKKNLSSDYYVGERCAILKRGVMPNIGLLYCIALVHIYKSAPA
jgi:hypothetical protein